METHESSCKKVYDPRPAHRTQKQSRPSRTRVEDPLSISMRFDVIAIGLGIFSDFVISLLGAVCLSVAGVSSASSGLYLWSLIVGLGAIAIGGYVTYIKSSSHPFKDTIAFGAIEI